MPLELWMAWRYLRAKKSNRLISFMTTFSLLGIMLGVAALIIVMAVMNGYRHEFLKLTLAAEGHVSVHADAVESPAVLVEAILQAPHVIEAIPLIEHQALLHADRMSAGVRVWAMNTEAITKSTETIRSGAIDFSGEPCLILGSELASSLQLQTGNRVMLIAPQGQQTMVGVVPRMKEYPVCAVISSGLYTHDSITVYMPPSEARRFFSVPSGVNRIKITLNDPFRSHDLAAHLRSALPPPLRVTDWQEANKPMLQALDTERAVMFIILTLIIIVAAFNIVSSLMMMVNEKSRAIAILRTMGMTPFAIMRLFMWCGLMVGTMGTLMGLVLGTLFALNIDTIRMAIETYFHVSLFNPVVYYLTHLPARIVPAEVVKVGALSFALSLLSTLYPSWKAAHQRPADVLRYDH